MIRHRTDIDIDTEEHFHQASCRVVGHMAVFLESRPGMYKCRWIDRVDIDSSIDVSMHNDICAYVWQFKFGLERFLRVRFPQLWR